jgi:hypothetical protein
MPEQTDETFLQRRLRIKAEREAAERPSRPLTDGSSALSASADDPRAQRWIEAKVAAQLDEVRSAAEGTRNDTLNRVAYSLGRRVPAYLDEQHIADQLVRAALDVGLDPREARLTVASGLRKGMSEPLGVSLSDDPTGGLRGLVNGPVSLAPPHAQPSTAQDPDVDPDTGEMLTSEQIAERAHQARVHAELVMLRARHEAKTLHSAELVASTFRVPTYTRNLTEELLIPDEPVRYTVDNLLPVGGNALLAAQYKSGKTTLILNLVRALADSEPFLGRFDVAPLSGRIAVFNYELSDTQFRHWLREIGVRNTDAVSVLNLRGFRLPLTSPTVEDWIVNWLVEHEISFWIADPFARAAVGTDENSNTEVGVWLDTFDVIKGRAGVQDAVLPTHTGRMEQEAGKERARGATRLDDWADVRWLLTKDDDENRFFRATGRDVELPEELLAYEPTGRLMSIGGGDRGWVRRRALEQAVLAFVQGHPGCTVREIQGAGLGKKEAVDSARSGLVAGHQIRVEEGKNNAQRHYSNEVGS